MSTPNDYPNTPDEDRKQFVEDMKARWMIEGGTAVPYIKLDLASERADQLRIKQAEYKERMETKRRTGHIGDLADTQFKYAMLGQLLEHGELDFLESVADLEIPRSMKELWDGDDDLAWSLTNGISAKDPEKRQFSWADYQGEIIDVAAQAFFVLQAYVNSGEADVKGGSGLPQLS